MTTRTAVVLVVLATLLLAVPFAVVTWAFEGWAGLLGFLLPLAALLGLCAAVGVLVMKRSGPGRAP